MQSGFFDLDKRHQKLNERDPLISLNSLIDWEDFRPELIKVRAKPRKSNAGRKPFDVVLMFKSLILQQLYNISDDDLEYQIRDRYSFCRFLGLSPEDRVPDAKTIWLFRENLTKEGLAKRLFIDFEIQLQGHGFIARKGQIVDASFINVPRQRNSREENKEIKEGKTPDRFKKNMNIECQKDVDARWTKKNNEVHYGYKNHASVDNKYKLIREFEVTSAEVHDSQVFLEILADNTSQDVWADSAYKSADNDLMLEASGYRNQVHVKGHRNKPLTEAQKDANHIKSKTRVRVEHVFGSMENEQGGMFVRSIGMVRAKTKICLMNLTYNMRRFVTLHRMSAPVL